MKKNIWISVDLLYGEKLFNFSSFYFDKLDATPFLGANVVVYRKNRIIDKSIVTHRGLGEKEVCFSGFERALKAHDMSKKLVAGSFHEQDVIIITFEDNPDFDFVKILIENSELYRQLEAEVLEALNLKPNLTLEEALQIEDEIVKKSDVWNHQQAVLRQ